MRLTAAEIRLFEVAQGTSAATRKRLRAVRRVQAGESVTTVAKSIGVSRRAVHHWLKQFREQGIHGIQQRAHTGRPAKANRDYRDHLQALLNDLTRLPPTGWRVSGLQAALEHETGRHLSLNRLYALLGYWGYAYRYVELHRKGQCFFAGYTWVPAPRMTWFRSSKVIRREVKSSQWVKYGSISRESVSQKRPIRHFCRRGNVPCVAIRWPASPLRAFIEEDRQRMAARTTKHPSKDAEATATLQGVKRMMRGLRL